MRRNDENERTELLERENQRLRSEENGERKETHIIIRELNTGHHKNTPVPLLPIVVADERALARGALAVGDARHAEAHVRGRVERRGVEDRDAVSAGLHLDGQVLHEALLRRPVLEDGLEGRVLERGAVDVARDPVVVEHGRALQEGGEGGGE